MRTRSVRSAVLCALTALPLLAQNASIQGIVKDPSDAGVPAARVVVTNLDTGLRRQVAANDSGSYSLPSLPVGRYKLTATAQGFSVEEVPELKLDVGQAARVDF